jgi:hypothetical protein
LTSAIERIADNDPQLAKISSDIHHENKKAED